MILLLQGVPAYLPRFGVEKKKSETQTLKRLEVEAQLGGFINELATVGARPLFKGLDLFAQAGADGGGPFDLVLRRKVGAVNLRIFGSANGEQGKQIAEILGAKLHGKWKIHIGPGFESIASKLAFVGGLARDKLSTLDDWTGADVFLDIEVDMPAEQTDLEKGGARGRGRKKGPPVDDDGSSGQQNIPGA